MKKKTFQMGNNPRTETPREAILTQLRIEIPNGENAVPTVSIEARVQTYDLLGGVLISDNISTQQINSGAMVTAGVQVKNLEDRATVQAEIISVLEKSGLIEKLVNLDINKFLENEQTKISATKKV